MKKNIITGQITLLTWIALILIVTAGMAQAAATITQTFELHPGWNAIFLEVQPEAVDAGGNPSKAPSDVFKDLIASNVLESVWTWTNRNSPVEFILNPDEGLAGKKGWFGYFPSATDNFLSNLYAVFVNRAYLIKVKGPQPVTLTVSGSPKLDTISWTTDSFNLFGFRIDSAYPPTFEKFFAPSSAHSNQAVYRLNNQGQWTFVDNPASAVMGSGEAYWVYCSGASKYQGPLEVEVNGNNLDFGKTLGSKTLTIKNLSSAAKAVRLAMLNPSLNIFTYKNINTSTQRIDWLKLEEMPPLSVPAKGTGYITIAVRREQMSSAQAETLLAIYDDEGIRILIPMSAEK